MTCSCFLNPAPLSLGISLSEMDALGGVWPEDIHQVLHINNSFKNSTKDQQICIYKDDDIYE